MRMKLIAIVFASLLLWNCDQSLDETKNDSATTPEEQKADPEEQKADPETDANTNTGDTNTADTNLDDPNDDKSKSPGPIAGSLILNVDQDIGVTIPKEVSLVSLTAQQSSASIAAYREQGKLILSTALALDGGDPNAGDPNDQQNGNNDPNNNDPNNQDPGPGGDPGSGGGNDAQDYLSRSDLLAKTLLTDDFQECMSAIPSEFNLAQGNFGHAKCFGPSVSYTNHPDTNQNGNFGNGDLGMFWDTAEPEESTGEACSARVANNLMKNLSSYGNTAIGMQAMVACVLRLSGEGSPAVGETIDGTSAMDAVDTSNRDFSIETASITRNEDSTEGPVFVSSITGTLKDVPRNLNKSFELTHKHTPLTDDNSEYIGRIQFIIKEFEDSRDAVISLAYDFDGANVRYRYRQAQTNQANAQAFEDNVGELTPDNSLRGWTEVISNMDTYGFGKVSFVWQTFDLLVFNAETKDDGTGTAYFGHNSVDDAPLGSSDSHTIKGLRCFPVNPPPAGSQVYSDFVQKQGLKFSESSGSWEAVTSSIQFAPTDSCSWNSDNDPSQQGQFTVTLEGQSGNTTQTLSYPLEHKLANQSDYTTEFSVPVKPD